MSTPDPATTDWIPMGGVKGDPGPPGLTLIEEKILGAPGTFDFLSIPQTFKHLRLIGVCKTMTGSHIYARFNGDAANNYNSGGGCTSGSVTYQAFANATAGFLWVAYCGTTSHVNFDVIIPNYVQTVLKRGLSGTFMGDGIYGGFVGGSWTNLANALNRVTLLPSSASFDVGSRVALYGI
jgi:hypothetical protein